jgi:cytochrome c oxidase subunit 2|tara:strand:- start:4231 stop:4863 length:633 start_codon:yes stop_codon:yes gene_type:complete
LNRIKHIICVLCFSIIFPASVNAASLDIDSMQLCQSCHGADLEGNKMLGAPSISGMQEWYLYRQMKNYQTGLRGIHSEDLSGQVMRMSILNFDDAQLLAISRYIAQLEPMNSERTVQGDLVTGEFVFQHCISCHGEYAEGDETISAPKLTGQNDWYIYRQLMNFQKGIRGQHPEDLYGKQMMEMAEMFNEEMFKDVTAYISILDQQSETE